MLARCGKEGLSVNDEQANSRGSSPAEGFRVCLEPARASAAITSDLVVARLDAHLWICSAVELEGDDKREWGSPAEGPRWRDGRSQKNTFGRSERVSV